MEYQSTNALQHFKNLVGIKFQLYNSLFTSLPFHRIERTGILLSLLLTLIEDGFKKKQSPSEIIQEFFDKHTTYKTEQEQLDLLFRFVQYAERQVVLFDALEDAAFSKVHDMNGSGTLHHLKTEIETNAKEKELEKKLKDFSVRLVLTAHPTQFYPGAVLGIINDLSRAIADNNVTLINQYLQQLGKTPFFKKQKPTPYDEAVSLIWYLENVFYPAAGRIAGFMKRNFANEVNKDNTVLKMGFWPGGDRDGNPFVITETTLKVADALRGSIIKCYYLEVRRIRRRLTFDGVENVLAELEKKLYNNIFIPGSRTDITKEEILATLGQIRQTLIYQHNSLFVHLVENLANKVELFGLHFTSLDIRQDSYIHTRVLKTIQELNPGTAFQFIPSFSNKEMEEIESVTEVMVKETIASFSAIKTIQKDNGEAGCNRYIISQCNSAKNVMEVMELFVLNGYKENEIEVDIIPLFETIDDLQNVSAVMRELYSNPAYGNHLKRRGNKQTIMLGFSDGTKDGGYLMANWSIYKAKEELTKISRQNNIDVLFFDGRGGPPARGGGKTHKFYASMGKNIANKEIQLTVQGQTVSSNFGTIDAAQFNIEQLMNAGISNELFSTKETTLDKHEEQLLQSLATESYTAYCELKDHPCFLDYLSHASALRFYAETNIGSRPAKRGATSRFTLKDLRAIPYVGSWSQLKQNVTGYYGLGSALKKMEEEGKWNQLKKLYLESLFFKTLIDNSEMAMRKCYFPLTEFLSKHPVYGEIRNKIYNEFELTKRYVIMLSGKPELMADYPVDLLSIQMRERIVLPLITMQQFAITKVRELEEQLINSPVKPTYEKLVMRCSFGIINAGRNSA
jgi:phosphoenolpyruvate carboxylase